MSFAHGWVTWSCQKFVLVLPLCWIIRCYFMLIRCWISRHYQTVRRGRAMRVKPVAFLMSPWMKNGR